MIINKKMTDNIKKQSVKKTIEPNPFKIVIEK
jgi:hypothetical protein